MTISDNDESILYSVFKRMYRRLGLVKYLAANTHTSKGRESLVNYDLSGVDILAHSEPHYGHYSAPRKLKRPKRTTD